VRGAQVAVEADPIGDALDQAARAGPLGVPLVAVNQLVSQDARDLRGQARGGLDAVDVAEREVDLLVVVVELGLWSREGGWGGGC